jgi:hypothetical protein
MNKKQDRRSIQIDTALHEELSYLQASVRVLMKGKNIDQALRKTAMTKILSALIKDANVPGLVKLLK